MMKVKILKTGKVEEYDPAYAIRLVEQGKAVPVPAEAEKEKSGKADGAK